MSTSALRKSSPTLRLLAAALALSSAAPAMAQEARSAPLGIYGGATFGVGASQWECGTTCDRAVFSGKVFGGKRLTPGLAAEVNYLFFGGQDRANDTGRQAATGIASERQKFRALTVGINWEVELLNDITNSLRVGMAFTRRASEYTYVDGSFKQINDYSRAPYFGAGLSYQLMRDMRLLASFDYIIDGHESHYLFSVGAGAEF
jgi:Outer membrane protein beta-barrel domain